MGSKATISSFYCFVDDILLAENFDETNRLETWDRMRIICTQPFRKDKPFGVSMLKLRAETDLDAINNNRVSDFMS